MDEKAHTVTCRLDDPDFQRLQVKASALGVNTSDFIRLIVRLPIEVKADGNSDRFVIIDPSTLVHLWMDARR